MPANPIDNPPIIVNLHGSSLPMNLFRTSRARARAFSLIETVLALGVVSFALTALISMMPVGLTLMRDSAQTTVQADVLRRLATEFQEMPLDQLASSTNMRYYSDQGATVDSDADGFVGVAWTVSPHTALLQDASTYTNANLRTVTISFYNRADRAKNPPLASTTNILFVTHGLN